MSFKRGLFLFRAPPSSLVIVSTLRLAMSKLLCWYIGWGLVLMKGLSISEVCVVD